MQGGEFRAHGSGARFPANKVQVQHLVSKHEKALCPDLPDDMVRLIISHCDRKGLRAAHMVNKTWQKAVRERVKKLAPSTVSMKHLDCFPSVSLAFLPCFFYQLICCVSPNAGLALIFFGHSTCHDDWVPVHHILTSLIFWHRIPIMSLQSTTL